MQIKMVIINGRPYQVHPDMQVQAIKELAEIDRERVLVVRRVDGTLQVAPDYRALPGMMAIDAPRFIYG